MDSHSSFIRSELPSVKRLYSSSLSPNPVPVSDTGNFDRLLSPPHLSQRTLLFLLKTDGYYYYYYIFSVYPCLHFVSCFVAMRHLYSPSHSVRCYARITTMMRLCILLLPWKIWKVINGEVFCYSWVFYLECPLSEVLLYTSSFYTIPICFLFKIRRIFLYLSPLIFIYTQCKSLSGVQAPIKRPIMYKWIWSA